jgi:quercetin dioxygenase-like cupin family protein
MVVTQWDDEPNAQYEMHAHPHREVRIVLAGGMTVVAGGRTFDLRPSDRIDLEAGEAHSAWVHPAGVTYLAGTER